MKSFNCGGGLVVFSLTFAFGICFVIVESQINRQQNKVTNKVVLNLDGSFESPKIKCKEKTSDIDQAYNLYKERLDLEHEISRLLGTP